MERSTWITVSIKAFVSEDEIAGRLNTTEEGLSEFHEDQIKEAMDQLIKEKLGELMPHDVPFKLHEVVID